MKTIKIGDKEYTLEFTFEAAECRGLVQSMFNVLSGAYILRNAGGAVGGTLSKEEEDIKRAKTQIRPVAAILIIFFLIIINLSIPQMHFQRDLNIYFILPKIKIFYNFNF